MQCLESNEELKKPSRRSKKVKNLEQEVELILSQEESDDELAVDNEIIENLTRTPLQNDKVKDISTSRASQAVLQDMLQTPRRSCRKSIKPTQDYDDIVSKSCSRSINKDLMITEEEEHNNFENADPTPAQPKWTPAKVGRVSQKRSRKSRRNTKAKQKTNKEIKVNEEHEVCPEIADDVMLDETENIVLVEPMENVHNKIKVENVIKTVVLNKNLTSPENGSESLKEFMEIEKHVNYLKDHDVSIQEDSEVFKELTSDETNEVSIHLIQEDSEDVKDVPREEPNFPIIEIAEENENKSIKSEKFEDSFGCYLKSREINISDLGLNPLKDDPDLDEKQKVEEEIDSIVATNESEEMPSLIVCDDDEELINKEANKLNETFETNDSVVIIKETSILTATSHDAMESLTLSDNEVDTPKKAPRIMLTTIDLQNQTLLTTPNLSFQLKPSSPKQPANVQLPSTPKQSSKAFRFPTPYRNRPNFKFNKVENEPPNNLRNFSRMSSLTSLEPKDIVLRGIRKRSFSVCIDGNVTKRHVQNSMAKLRQDRMVSFYSPANQTTIIDDLDICIAKSVKKQKTVDIKDSSNKFVTTRRKRSMSVDESLISSSMLVSRLPRPIPTQNTPTKSQTLITSSSKPISRTKLPNFAAIHNKNFQKMENLLDHVNRKQERSKILINSNTKIRPASAQKIVSLIKSGNNNKIEKPKALKKIDLGVSSNANISSTSNMSFATTTTTANTTSTAATDITKSQENLKPRKLPNPHSGITKVIKTGVIPQRIPHNYHNQKAPKESQQQQIRKYLKPTQSINNTINRDLGASSSTIVKQKANFNLSTSIKKPNPTLSFMENLNTTSNGDKMASRLHRHMDLFKGRATRAEIASRKNDAVIKGVRSNRRFELQMQHRKNMEN